MPIPEITRASTAREADVRDPCRDSRATRGRRFGEILRAAGSIAIAALPGVGAVLSKTLPTMAGGHVDPTVLARQGASEALEYLELQRAISREARHFETLSNVMKARHDASMNTIRNLRS